MQHTPSTCMPPQPLPPDSWYGIDDPAERRKRQNRLNQRAYRQRKQQNSSNSNGVKKAQPTAPQLPLPPPQNHQLQQHPKYPEPSSNLQPPAIEIAITACSPVERRMLTHPSASKRQILLRQLAEYHNSFTLNNPTASHLLTLTRVNVHRAFVSNMLTLGIDWDLIVDDNAISPFTKIHPEPATALASALPPPRPEASPLPDSYPENLRPTALQLSTPHHPWIDLFPCPRMRDNLIKRGNEWDDEELCTDIMGYWEGNSAGPNSLLVWGEPSQVENWEVTEGFLDRWGWVVDGCEGIMRGTEVWRMKRGEKRLGIVRRVRVQNEIWIA
ncbi:hypothetical protein BJY04DRAFT_204818 [Aspergillus karnatakaensis]|uniref:bZIP transcription factor n=1 Tax=Aspergillus karnatakaensis TaxID=1810916 RepID=UPI003CCC959A